MKKTGLFVCTLWLSVLMKSVVEQGFFHEFAFSNKALKTFIKFKSVENVRSSNAVEFKFKLSHNSSCWKCSSLSTSERVLKLVKI